jgi:uncharacterized protein involved in exopolysaccharide biosynthesis/Mrp family chromosome partitioning ATPase
MTADSYSGNDEPGVNLKEILATVVRRRRTVIATATIVVFAVIAYLFMATDVYTATAQLVVEPLAPLRLTDHEPESFTADAMNGMVENQLRIIESKSVLLRVVAGEKLDTDAEFVRNAPARAPRSDMLTPTLKQLQALEQLRHSLRIKRADKSFVIDVSVLSRDPIKAARLANAVVKEYVNEQSSYRAATAKRIAAAYTAQLPILREVVRKAELELQQYRYKHNIPGSSDTASGRVNQALVGLQELEGNLEASRKAYGSFLLRARMAAEQADVGQMGVRIISSADPPTARSWPLGGVLIGLGTFVGLGFGISLGLIRDQLDQRVFTRQELERHSPYPVLTLIPHLEMRLELDPARALNDEFVCLLDAIHENRPPPGRSNDIVLITSAAHGEGKSTIIHNLAHAAAKDGLRVLALSVNNYPGSDVDLVSTHTLLHCEVYPTAPNCHTGDAERAGEVSELQVMKGSDFSPVEDSHQRVLPKSAAEIQRLLYSFEHDIEGFDLVLLECTASSDNRLLRTMAAVANKIIIVARAGETRATHLWKMTEILKPVATGVSGIIFNDVRDSAT